MLYMSNKLKHENYQGYAWYAIVISLAQTSAISHEISGLMKKRTNHLHESTVIKTMVGAQRARRGRLGVWVVLRIN
ncbi:hypothetical protein THOM_2097 [Trachipleistophora hominis]|uniref:Uncharacterized protein n=1 Tax=Trachipleistophora hominis TaxID=72359 RepID=L7JU67_TRAHO|nr:hypothetical protein THOM_2097 [Trachipleistophora hominis]